MRKSTTPYRKCAYCPHHAQKSCCCGPRKTISHVSGKNNSTTHSRPKKKNNNSSASYINTTLPISHVNNTAYPNSSILVENSILRTENDMLKRELGNNNHHSQYQNISTFTKEDLPTYPGSQYETARTYRLQDKLFYSNKNLQDVLLELDNLSRINKELNENNTKLDTKYQKMLIHCEELEEQLSQHKRKNRKLKKMLESLPNQEQIQRILETNNNLKYDNQELRDEVESLKHELAEKGLNKKNRAEKENLSPEWVANTSTKLNVIERNLSRIEEENKENVQWNAQSSFLFKDSHRDEDLEMIKHQIAAAIKALKLSSQDSNFFNSAIDQLLISSNASGVTLLKGLCEALLSPLLVSFSGLSRDLERKIKFFQAKFEKTVSRMRNLTIKLSNQRLRSQSMRVGNDLTDTRFS